MFDELLAANLAYAESFDLRGVAARAARAFGLVTCMDSRIEPLVMLGLRPGDAKILRNAGGRVTSDTLRSLVLATTYLGVRFVSVLHHTDCALSGKSDADVRSGLTSDQARASQSWDYRAMPDPDRSLAEDVAAVSNCDALAGGVLVEGWRYDVQTGRIDRVIPMAS